MAIITATALAGATTITAGTIAAGAAFAASTAGTALSLSQASKQKKAQRAAEEAADEALKSAKKQLEVNYLEGLSIPKEAYELQREAGLSGSAQLLQAATEGNQRGAAAGAGRANVFNQAAQTKARVDMSKELMDLQKGAAVEDARLQGLKASVDLAEVRGQQAAAQQAAINRSAAQGQAIKGFQSMGAIAGDEIPEYLNQGDPNDPFAGVSYGQYLDNSGGKLSRPEYRDILGGGTSFGNFLSSVSRGIPNLFTNRDK